MESTTEHPGSSTTDNVSRIGDNISKWLGHLEWQRKGNSSKWQELCSPLKTHRPYQSWEELYSTLWSKWGWVVGVWCGDKSYQGNLKVMQYNDNTGKIDCWALVGRDKYLAFSIPGSFDSIDNDPRIHTTEKLTFMLRQKRGKLLLDFPDAGETQPWPPHWKLSSSLPPSVKDNPILTRDYDATPGSFSDDVFCVVFVMDAARDKFLEMKLDDIEKLSSDQVDDLEFFGRISPALMHPSDNKPYQGLWRSNYGPEYLLFIQRNAIMLEAIVATADFTVHLGLYAFIVPNLSTHSRVCHEPEFSGAHAFAAFLQRIDRSLEQPSWEEVELIVISEQKMVIQSECGMLRYDRADLEGIMK